MAFIPFIKNVVGIFGFVGASATSLKKHFKRGGTLSSDLSTSAVVIMLITIVCDRFKGMCCFVCGWYG